MNHKNMTAMSAPVAQRSATTKGNFRADIQGLRAVAVLAVVADHLFGWPTGGFVGVDVFFVISGFLITGLMLREYDRTNRISWTGFYRRRARRILPAATVVIIVVLLVSFLLFRRARFQSVLGDAVWSSLFVSNWHFAATGTDYFQATTVASPLQHFWSLAVEEQFYLVWPVILIVLIATLRGGTRRRLHLSLGCAFLGVVVLSFWWAMLESVSSPTIAYFSTLTRAWELGMGALLAVLALHVSRIGATLRFALLYGGLGLIVASLFVVTSATIFPGPGAALPVLGAIAVIASGIGCSAPGDIVLRNRPSVYIGTISYSLYLWHFPVIVFLSAVVDDASVSYYLMAILFMAALSVASYRWIEAPFQSPIKGAKKERGSATKVSNARRVRVGALILAFLAAGTSWVAVWRQSGAAIDAAKMASAVSAQTRNPGAAVASPEVSSVGSRQASVERVSEISSALQATAWPIDLNPAIDSVDKDASVSQWVQDGCLGMEKGVRSDDAIINTQHCLYGDPGASKRAVVIGDSVAISYVPGLLKALGSGWSVQLYTLVQCPVSDVAVFVGAADRKTPHQQCSGFRQWAIDQINASSPDLVVASDSIATLKMEQDAGSDSQALELWRNGLTASLKSMGSAKEVVFIPGPPVAAKSIQECATQLSSPSDCVTVVSESYRSYSQAAEQAVAAAGGNARYIPTQAWFCSSGSSGASCPIFIGGAPVFVDKSHLTNSASELLGPSLADGLQVGAGSSGASG